MSSSAGTNHKHASNDQALSQAFEAFEHFSKCLLDAYVLINEEGRVIKANALFSALVGMRSKQILKSNSLDELVKFTLDGARLTAQDLLTHMLPTRLDEVRGEIGVTQDHNLILGVYPFLEEGAVIGAFILIRDVTAETNLQDKYKVKATQSVTDKLTGLYNRTYFDQYLPEVLERLERKGRKKDTNISIVMADVDHFKKINDTHGHPAGDYVLETIAHLFKTNFRKTDVVCRFGGEEFLTILPSTDIFEAYTAADKLRKVVASEVFKFNGVVIPVTISMGVVQIDIGAENGKQAIARADSALYFAKENGRNRVCTNKNGMIS